MRNLKVEIRKSSPVLYFPLEDSGTPVSDDAQNTTHAVSGTGSYQAKAAANRALGCMDFNGTDCRIALGDKGTDAYTIGTIEAWINPDVLDTSEHIIFKEGGNGNGWGLGFYNSNLRMAVMQSSVSKAVDYAQSNMSTGTLYHVVGIQSVTDGYVKLFVNGKLVGQLDDTIAAHNGSTGCVIASNNDGTASDSPVSGSAADNAYFNGAIGHVAIYDRELSEKEIRAHYLAGIAPGARGLLAQQIADAPFLLWPLDDEDTNTSATSMRDLIHGQNATLQSTGWSKAQSSIEPGIPNKKCIYLNDTTGSILSPSNPSEYPDGTEHYTMECMFTCEDASVSGPDHSIMYIGNTAPSEWGVQINTDYSLYIWGNNKSPIGSTNAGDITVGKPHHLVVSRDASNIYVYIDGKLVKKIAETVWSITFGYAQIGSYRGTSTTALHDGYVSNFAVYDYQLSAEQVLRHYEATVTDHNPTITYAEMVARDGAVHHYRLSDSTSTVVDAIAANNGTTSGSPTQEQPGLLLNDDDTCTVFTGANHIALNSALSTTLDGTSRSVEMLFKADNINTGVIQTLFDNEATNAGFSIRLQGDDADIELWWYDSSLKTLESSVFGQTGQVHHLVCTLVNSSRARIYLDGELVGEAVTGAIASASVTPEIAREISGTAYFSGSIDEVSIYDFEMTPAMVKAHYAKARMYMDSYYKSLIVSHAPVAYYPLDEPYASTIYDVMSGLAGTVDAGLSDTFEQNSLLSGDNGKSVDFNGAGDDITMASAPVNSNVFTCEAWIKPDATTLDGGYHGILGDGSIEFGVQANKLLIYVSGANVGSTTLTADQIYHAVVVSTGSNAARLYLDGVQDGSFVINPTFAPLYIGSFSGGAEYFSGPIQHVAIYDRVLTDAEIMEHYLAGVAFV